jgi:hydroxymethylbilane synthase
MASLLRIGTRGSPLALAMTAEVVKMLRERHPELATGGAIETVVITTTGDRVQDRRLEAIGGKGLFTKEIDEALLEGRVDLAVNSAKDMPTKLPPGLVLAATPRREDPRDAFVSLKAKDLANLPKGASIGTASLRRQAQVLNRRPDLKVVLFRGNVETRLRKLAAGEADATLLALAGLKRLGREDAATALVPTDDILPAVGQGAMGLTSRADDKHVRDLLSPLDHRGTFLAVTLERALLAELDGSCHTPIAALAEPDGAGGFSIVARLARPDGGALVEARRATGLGTDSEAIALGHAIGEELRRKAGPGFF